MYALFASIPLVGHLNPLIRQAAELQQRGWRVAVANFGELRSHVAAEGGRAEISFVDLGPLGDAGRQLRRNEEEASRDANFARGTLRIVRGLTAVWPAMYDGLLAAVENDRPDVIVADLFCSAAMCVAERASIPLVVNNPDLLASLPLTLLPPADDVPFLFSGKSIRNVGWGQRLAAPAIRGVAAFAAEQTIGRDLNTLRASRGLAPIGIDALLRDRTILVDGAFGLEYQRPIPSNVHMVGPMLPSVTEPISTELERWLDDGPPVVYANLGTMAVATDAQLAAIGDALTDRSFRGLWILKDQQATRLPPRVADSVRIMGWGPPPFAVLAHPNVRVFVSHCGINSVYESLFAGTPIVGIPMFADQRDMAARVADAGAGIWLDKRTFDANGLRAAIVRVLGDDAFRAAIPDLQASFARAGGVARAADLITDAARAARPRPR